MALHDVFAETLNEYASQYDQPRESYSDVSDYYKSRFGSHWRTAMANDLGGIINTKGASVSRQLARYDQGTRGIGKKYAAGIAQLGVSLPPKRNIPKKRFKVSVTIYVQISGSTIKRQASGTFDNLDGTLQDLLDQYADDGAISGEEWMEGLEDIGEITIEEL